MNLLYWYFHTNLSYFQVKTVLSECLLAVVLVFSDKSRQRVDVLPPN